MFASDMLTDRESERCARHCNARARETQSQRECSALELKRLNVYVGQLPTPHSFPSSFSQTKKQQGFCSFQGVVVGRTGVLTVYWSQHLIARCAPHTRPPGSMVGIARSYAGPITGGLTLGGRTNSLADHKARSNRALGHWASSQESKKPEVICC